MSKRTSHARFGCDLQPSLPARVPAVVRALARWAVLSSVASSAHAGCATAATAAEPARAEPRHSTAWQRVNCPEGAYEPEALARVRLAQARDYVAIFGQSQATPVRSYNSYEIDAAGFPCAGAGDAERCSAQLERAKQVDASCEQDQRCPNFLVAIASDRVERSSDRKDLLALLGAIDDVHEAMALAMFDGFAIRCAGTLTTSTRGTETRKLRDAFELDSEWEDCGQGVFHQRLRVSADGTLSDLGRERIGESYCSIGRRPDGLCLLPAARTDSALGAFFAAAAQLEAASVFAFERLARELVALSAPEALVAAAARSALDELRHSHAMTMLARRAGSEPGAAQVGALPVRAPFAIALENAVEGCVRETYGALLAHHQALAARDRQVRAVMAIIAEDETRHAQLAWQVAAWLEPRLPVAARAELQRARADALHQLAREVEVGLSAADAAAIGWPSAQRSLILIERMASTLALA